MSSGPLTPQTTSLEKMPSGIEGFDEVTHGGLPRNRTSLVIGGPGCGKTVFALQTLVNGARQWGEPGIFVAFEENTRQIVANAASFGWDIPALEKEAKIFFLDARLSADVVQSGKFELVGMLASLKAKADEMGAKRIVFDSIDSLLTLLNDPVAERRELYILQDWLSHSDLTGIITSKIDGSDRLIKEPYGLMLFMTDCVVLLSHHIAERVSLRELHVVKYRGSRYGEAEFPMVIGPQGVEVSSFGPAETRFKVSTERVSTGVARLDTMLDGGYFRGASVLISGAPGTAKSTLAAAFAQAACGRGEKALYVSFDESAGMIERDMSSVGIRLSPHVESGLLMLYSAHASATSGEEHFIKLKALIREHKPRCLVIDPLSAMARAGGRVTVESFAQQLFYLTRLEGITVVVTSLTTGNDSRLDDPAAQVSTSADTWIYVSFMAKQGERNRALTIVKSRGTKHSNQVRELILSDQGVTLTDVFTAGGEVLMGSLRWEKERAVELEGKRMRAEIEHKRRVLELGEAETVARIDVLKHELEARRGELALLKLQQEEQKEQTRIEPEDLGALRGADKDPT